MVSLTSRLVRTSTRRTVSRRSVMVMARERGKNSKLQTPSSREAPSYKSQVISGSNSPSPLPSPQGEGGRNSKRQASSSREASSYKSQVISASNSPSPSPSPKGWAGRYSKLHAAGSREAPS